MTATTYILFNYKNEPKFLFSESNRKKVLKFIENNIDDYFEYRTQEQQMEDYKCLCEIVNEQDSLHTAFNITENCFTGYSIEIEHIKDIQR